jgi:hypothetical protein
MVFDGWVPRLPDGTYIFIPKNPNFRLFERPWDGKFWGNVFHPIGTYILCLLVIVCGRLVHFSSFLYIVRRKIWQPLWIPRQKQFPGKF